MGEPSRRRVTYGQLENMWEFLIKRRDLAMGYNKTSQAREFSKRMWNEIAQNLNSHGDGAVKDGKGWCKYWNDYKSKLKKMAVAARASHQRTGGGPSTVNPMTEIEKKFLHILGEDFGSGLPGIRVEPFEEETQVQDTHQTQPPATSKIIQLSEPLSDSVLSTILPITPRRSPRRRLPQTSPPHHSIHSTPRRSPLHHASPSPLRQRSPLRQHSPILLQSTQRTRRIPRPRHVTSSLHEPTPTAPPHPDTPASSRPPNTPAPPRLNTHPPPQPAPITERHRRPRRVPPMPTAEGARRAIIAETQKQTQIQERSLEMWRLLISELREIKEILQQRSTQGTIGE